jgi:hypothetical protein
MGSEDCGCNELYGDGYKDLVVKFETADMIDILMLKDLAGQTIPLTITGNLKEGKGGTPFSGQDCIKILKNKPKNVKDLLEKFKKEKQNKGKK